MPTARELLEQADALMRRNRNPAIDDIPVLTDSVSTITEALLAGALAHEQIAPARALSDPIPTLTERVESSAAVTADAVMMEGDPSDWLDFEHAQPSIIGEAPDSIAIVPPVELARDLDDALLESAEHEEIELTSPVEDDFDRELEARAAEPPIASTPAAPPTDIVLPGVVPSAAALAAAIEEAVLAHPVPPVAEPPAMPAAPTESVAAPPESVPAPVSPVAEAAVEAQQAPEVDAAQPSVPESFATPEPESFPTSEPESFLTPEPEPVSRPEPESAATPEPESFPMPEPESFPMSEPESFPMSEPESFPMSEAESSSTREPESFSAPEPESLPLSEPESSSTREPESFLAPEPESFPHSEPESSSTPEPVQAETAPATSGPWDDQARWDMAAEEIRMQVLQRIDIFTDTGLREQLGSRLKPIVDRASADLVATINQHVGELLRAYVAEAIEREIAQWRETNVPKS